MGPTGPAGATGPPGSAATATVPGGANTQLQFNDGGAFGGDATLTWDKTGKVLNFGGDTNLYRNGANSLKTDGYFYTGKRVQTGEYLVAATDVYVGNALAGVGSGTVYFGSTFDVAIGHNALGVLEINNGSLGSFRDLIARTFYIGTDARLVAIAGGVKMEVRNPGTGLWASADQWTNP
jgi:hypothetical protein